VPEHAQPRTVADEFSSSRLSPTWQWPWDRTPQYSSRGGILTIRASGRDVGFPADTIVGRAPISGDYVATAQVLPPSDRAGFAGLSVYGNPQNAIGLSLSGGQVILWRREKGVQHTVATAAAPGNGPVQLRVAATGGAKFEFSMSADGRKWDRVGPEAAGGDLPPWDLAVRVALAVGGPAGSEGRFDWIRVESVTPR
jgi:hypothetical protein